MPRDGAGNYTLPTSNPVVPFTTIATAWANPTLSDVAATLTDSLSRSGQGGMLAPFKVDDGTLAAPGLGFLNEPGIGLYRESAGLAHLVNSGSKVISLKPSEAQFPSFATYFSDQRMHSVGAKSFIIRNAAGELIFAPSTAINNDTPDLALGASLLANGVFDVYALSISGSGQGITYPDGSVQTTATGIKLIQRGVITIPSGNLVDVTVTAVNMAKAELRFLGSRAVSSADVTSAIQSAPAILTLFNSTTIRAQRYVGTQNTASEISWELTEYL